MMSVDLAERFGALWQSSNFPPDVFSFLEQGNGSDSSGVLAVLLIDQQHRWKTDTPLKVEDYLTRLPDLVVDAGRER